MTSSPGKELRVLVLEDVEADAELMIRFLERSAMAFQWKHVATREAFVAALAGFAPDVILADYSLPGLDGRAALALAMAAHPDVPVIAVSGTIVDEAALELVKAGARDYVLKTNLARLPSSIERAIAEAEAFRERKRAEEALRESERWLRMSQDIARIGHYVFDVPRDQWTSSEALNSIFGIDESFPRKGSGWLRIVHPDDRAMMGAYLADLLARGARFDMEYRVVDQAGGAVRWVHGLGELQRAPGGEPVRLVGTIQDITGRKLAEIERNALHAQLALASRLAAMGTLVSGLAHEINNPLVAQLAGQGVALEIAREFRSQAREGGSRDYDHRTRQLDDAIEALEDAQAGGHRVAQIVRDMAALAQPASQKDRVCLLSVVEDAVRFLPPSITGKATITVEDLGPPDALGAEGQVKQVVTNLVSNATKATPLGKRGEIVIRVGPGKSGRARLEVIDHGVGIAPDVLGRIFDPFFTTRPMGPERGTGLGLAICHAIATAHGGTISAQSEVGKGSTFRMELPAALVEA
jgi:PAS domain S-box-containing protein